jgi:hypothetical protein
VFNIDPAAETKYLGQAMNLKQTQQVALCSDKDDRVNLNAAGRKIFGLTVDDLLPEDYDGTALEEATNKRAS